MRQVGGRYHHRAGWRGHALWCLLVLGLLVTHLALMTTERHAAVMGAQHGAAGIGTLAALAPAMLGDNGHSHPAPAAPNMVFGDCPAQQAVLPLVLFLLLLSAALALTATPDAGDRLAVTERLLARGRPPSLDRAKHRALLQVFLI